MARSFNAAFTAEMVKRSPVGPAPINLIEFGFDSPVIYSDQNGLDYLNDAVTPTEIDGTNDSIGGLAVNSTTGDVYACERVGDEDIYKRTAGKGDFVALGETARQWSSIAVNSTTGDVYATVIGGDIYKQTAGVGAFVALGGTNRQWTGIAINSTNDDVYATVIGGDIYKQTASAGAFVAEAIGISPVWWDVAIDSITGDVYACIFGGDIYKKTGGIGSWVAQNQTVRSYTGISINPGTGDVYVCVTGGTIYKRVEGVGAFVTTGQPTDTYSAIAGDSASLYSGNNNTDIFQYIASIEGLVKSWDFVDTNLGYTNRSSIVNIPSVPEFQVTMINSGDPRFTDNITTADPIEGIEVILYQYFTDLTFPDKEILFKGVVVRVEYDEFECRLTLKGVWDKYNRVIGEDLLITETDYPSCDPDDVGAMQNIAYGSVQRVPCHALDAGGVDNLASTITAIQTTLPLVDATKFRAIGNGKLGIESISWTGKSGNTLTGVTRGAGAAASTAGTVVFEVLTDFIYGIASHSADDVQDIYADGFIINRVVTTYTGQSGDELAGYTGQAVVKVPGLVSRADASLLLQDNGVASAVATAAVAKVEGVASLTVSDVVALFNALGQTEDEGSHEHTGTEQIITWRFDNLNAESNAIDGKYLFDNDFDTGGQISTLAGFINIAKAFLESYNGDPTEIRSCMHLRSDHGGATMGFRPTTGSVNQAIGAAASTTYKSAWTAVNTVTDTWTKIQALIGQLTAGGTLANNWTSECWLEIKYTPNSGASAATGVNFALGYTAGVTAGIDKSTTGEKGGTVSRTGVTNLSGNSTVAVEVGAQLTADFSGNVDSDSGASLIEVPDGVFQHILETYCGFPSGDIGSSFSDSNTFYTDSARNYIFAFVISKPIRAESLLARLAVQCRSRFYVTPYGTAELVVRQLGQSSGNAIASAEIRMDSMHIYRSNEADIVNSLNAKWDVDWKLKTIDKFKKTEPYSDATSITRYGVKEPADSSVFEFFAVKDDSMAGDVAGYWLSLLKDSRVRPSFSLFLDNLDVEAGDYLGLTHALDNMSGFVVEVIAVRYVLGSGKNKVLDRIEVTTLEN